MVKPLRRWWWRHVRRYDSELCSCGRPVRVVWHADDVLWAEIHGDPGVLCVECFDRRCAARGVILTWEPRELVRAD